MVEGKRVVVLQIPAAKNIPTSYARERYIRIGSSKENLRKYPEKEVYLFEVLRHGFPTIENTPSEYQDLSFEKLFIYYGAKGVILNPDTFKKNLSLYSDRIEILSRGALPPEQTMEGFYAGESVPVNKKLSEIFLQLHISEKTGRGVPIITDLYGREAFEFRKNSIVVKIPFNWINVMKKREGADGKKKSAIKIGDKKSAIKIGDKKTAKTESRLMDILQCMEAGVEYKTNEIAERIMMKPSRTRELLGMLVERGEIEILGEHRGRKYRRKL